MGRDLEQRYLRMGAGDVDHVCTGNTAYRASALRRWSSSMKGSDTGTTTT